MEILLEPVEPDSLEGPNLLQSGFWCRFKEMAGWVPRAFRVHARGDPWTLEFPLFLHLRRLGPGFSLAYAPWGPDLPKNALTPDLSSRPGGEEKWDLLRGIADALGKQIPSPCRFLRFDLPWEKEAPDGNGKTSNGVFPEGGEYLGKPADFLPREGKLRKAPVDVQPPDTVVLDLTLPAEVLLERMKQKTRYNTRLALKKGVKVRMGRLSDLPIWYSLYRQTAIRDKISIHPYSYYRTLFELALRGPSRSNEGEVPLLSLFLATYDGEEIGGIIVALYKKRAVYLYGASSNRHRNVMASYLLQWEGIQWAQREGAEEYDFFGIPPTADPGHPMAGLYQFKTGFGGRIVRRWGCWDYPIRYPFYALYRQGEKLRYWYHKVVRKRFF